MKYTLGPWKICYKDDLSFQCMTVIVPESSPMAVENDGQLDTNLHESDVIAITFHQLRPLAGDTAFDRDEHDGNDRLIAAAPEMYELLLRVYCARHMTEIRREVSEFVKKMGELEAINYENTVM